MRSWRKNAFSVESCGEISFDLKILCAMIEMLTDCLGVFKKQEKR